jgi:hypothetical protein
MKLWLCVDPGETTGWSLWDADGKLRYADQTPMWQFADMVFACAEGKDTRLFASFFEALTEQEREEGLMPKIHAMVVEQWQLYPWELQNLAWDECRTARVIGALTLICRQFGIKFILQGADIKNGAQAAGAEALYLEPVHENRHANDSIQHGVFFLAKNGKPPA